MTDPATANITPLSSDTVTGPNVFRTTNMQRRLAWDTRNNRTSKHRSSRACLSCRNRKVRCDALSGGLRCTNCRLDNVECILKESKRGRRPAAASIASSNSPTTNPPVERQSTPPPATGPNDYFVTLSFGDQQTPVAAGPTDEIHVRTNVQHQTTPSTGAAAVSGPSPQCQEASIEDFSVDGTARQYLPPYIQPLPRHLSPEDMDYLAKKDALTIPDDELRDELLRNYINIVYSSMPSLDIEAFLGPIIRNDGRTVSLLLFQAVMFAGVTYVNSGLLRARGYRSRKEARKVFFARVRLIHGLDCESDRLALIQAVLLMTYWYDCPDDDKDTWYWMGIALSLAQVVGLHLDPKPLRITNEKKKLRRRVWWSCVIRDRLLALGLRRPGRILDGDFDVPPLTLDDFELGPPSPAVATFLGDSGFTRPDPAGRTIVAGMIIELSNLCICIGHILHSQYTVLNTYQGASEYLLKVSVRPRKSQLRLKEFDKCDTKLEEWLQAQDPRSRYTPENHTGSDEKTKRIIRLHQALLHMIYLTALLALHKPQVFYSDPEGNDDGNRKKVSRERVTQAATAMTKLAFDLQMSKQLRFLSTSSVPAFLSASLVHLIDIRTSDEMLRNACIGRFYQCVYVLQQLQEVYASADYALRFLNTVLKSADIHLPFLGSGISAPSRVEEDRQPLSVAQRPTLCTSPSRLASAYPSPPSSGNQPCVDDSTSSEGILPPEMVQQPSTSVNTFMWAPSDDQLAFSEQPADLLSTSPYASIWDDVDSLIPTLINCNTDSSMAITGNVQFPFI